jgi:hypothetical protein
MEIQGFGGSLVGKTSWVWSRFTGDWIPWEFLPSITCRILIHDHTSSILFTEEWEYCIAPKTPKDWSCTATIVKALSTSASVLVVLASSGAPPNFLSFLTSVPVSRVLLSAEEPAIPVDAVFSAPNAVFRDLSERIPGRKGHGSYTAPSTEGWADLTATLSGSGLSVVLTDVDESEWTLFWYKPSDSHGLTATDAKRKVGELLSTAQRVLAAS